MDCRATNIDGLLQIARNIVGKDGAVDGGLSTCVCSCQTAQVEFYIGATLTVLWTSRLLLVRF